MGWLLAIILNSQYLYILHLFGSRFHIMSEKIMKLLIYTAPWCRDCHVAKSWLARHNIPFEEIDIEETPGAADEVVRQTGKRAIPQFVVNGAWVQPYTPGQGFKYQEMADLFGIGPV